MLTLKIFVSSPGDVGEERELARRVIERLSGEFRARAVLVPILWEHEPILSTSSFQGQITRPSEADIVVCVLWTRLGTRLPAGFEKRADGSTYESGTAFELEDAQAAFERSGRPELLVYRKTAPPKVSLDDPTKLRVFEQQWEALVAYLERWFVAGDGTFKKGFHEFPSADEFERKLTQHLRSLIRKRLMSVEDGPAEVAWASGSPFRGLKAFEPEDAPVFFGRTRAVSEIIAQLSARAGMGTAFLPVCGMSGSGKSSLLRAGVIATLTRPGVVEGVAEWRYCILRPSDGPDLFRSLAQAILGETALEELSEDGLSPDQLAKTMRRSPEDAVLPLQMALTRIRGAGAPGSARLLVLVDQFEELFTTQAFDAETRTAFVSLLSSLANAHSEEHRIADQIWVIMAVRGDFYHRCVQIPGFSALSGENGPYYILPPRPREIADIIHQPAEAAGLLFEYSRERDTSLDLVIEDEAVQAPQALPLLEFALEELYTRRRDNRVLTFDAYDALGGLSGALGRQADKVFSELPPDVRAALPKVLGLLVNPGRGDEDQPTARVVPLAEFPEGTPQRFLIDALHGARLLAYDGSESEARVRVTHEAILTHWQEARALITADQERIRARQRLEATAREWEEHDRSPDFLLPTGGRLSEAIELRDEWHVPLNDHLRQYVDLSEITERKRHTRQVRRAWSVSAAMAVFGLIAAVGGVLAWQNQLRAEADRKVALGAAEKLVNTVATGLGQATGVSTLTVETMLEDAEEVIGDLADGQSDDGWLDSVRARMFLAFSDAYGKSGNDDRRLEMAEKAREAADRLVAVTPNALEPLDLLASSLAMVGDAHKDLGAMAEAADAYQAALKIRSNLVRRDDAAAEHTRKYAAVIEKLGDLDADQGRHQHALARFNGALTVLNGIPSPDSATRRGIMVVRNKLGYAYRERQKYDLARDSFTKAVEAAEALGSSARTKESVRDIIVAHYNLGRVLVDLRELRPARNHLWEAFRRAEDLVASDPKNAVWQHDLALASAGLGDVMLLNGKREIALANYGNAARITEDLVALQPDDIGLWVDLASTIRRQGDAFRMIGNDAENALAHYDRSLGILSDLIAQYPRNAELRHQAGLGRLTFARLMEDRGDDVSAIAEARLSASLLDEAMQLTMPSESLRQDFADAANLAAWLLATTENAEARDPAAAVELAARAVEMSGGSDPAKLDTLAMAYFAGGDVAASVAVCQDALEAAGDSPGRTRQAIAENCERFTARLEDR